MAARPRGSSTSSGRPLRADEIEENDLLHRLRRGRRPRALARRSWSSACAATSSTCRPERAAATPDGIVAYSKICTHAGCAIALYRAPLFAPTDPKPALVCPCHYSTFDPATGGTVTFGPAGRKLPMLPLEIDPKGFLRARGNFDGPVGPSWWGVRLRRPTT